MRYMNKLIMLLSGFQLENHRMFHNIQGVSLTPPMENLSEVPFWGINLSPPFICAFGRSLEQTLPGPILGSSEYVYLWMK